MLMSDEYTPSAEPTSRTSTRAIVSLIAAITGWTIFPLVGSIVAVITGHMAKREIADSGGMVEGDGLATAGLVLGYLSLGLALCACLFFFGLLLFGLLIATTTSSSSLIGLGLLFA
jgi:hypothetical protein